jgi:hypothetical protein
MKKKVKDQNGTAIVEFAIILPILFLFVLGIIEFGALLYDKAVITNASREGARTAIVFHADPINGDPLRGYYTPYDNDFIEGKVRDYLSTFKLAWAGPDSAQIEVEPDYLWRKDSSNPGDAFSVRVQYTYTFLILPKFALGLLRNSVDLEAVTEMRRE